MTGAKSSPGQIFVAPGALEAFTASGQSPLDFLQQLSSIVYPAGSRARIS